VHIADGGYDSVHLKGNEFSAIAEVESPASLDQQSSEEKHANNHRIGKPVGLCSNPLCSIGLRAD